MMRHHPGAWGRRMRNSQRLLATVCLMLLSALGLAVQIQPAAAQSTATLIQQCIDPRTEQILKTDFCRCLDIVRDPKTNRYYIRRLFPVLACRPRSDNFSAGTFASLGDNNNNDNNDNNGGGGGGG